MGPRIGATSVGGPAGRFHMDLVHLGLVACAAFYVATPGAHALLVANHHPYDDLADGAPIGEYRGFTYNADATALCNPRAAGFPSPPSGCVAFSPTGVVSPAANDPTGSFLSLDGWCATRSPFSNPDGVVVELTDVAGRSTVARCRSAYGTGANFHVTGTGLPSTTVEFRGAGGSFIVDALTFRSVLS